MDEDEHLILLRYRNLDGKAKIQIYVYITTYILEFFIS